MVALTFSGFRQAGRYLQSFHVRESWWVQDKPGTFRTHSAVLCIEFLLFGERRKEKRKKNPMKQERLLSHWMAKWLLAVHST
jgi:hypothetical protein